MRFTIHQGDVLPVLPATLRDSQGVAYDLTGCAVHFIMRPFGGDTYVKSDAVIMNALTGEVEYRWAEADTETAGDFLGSFEITYPDQKILTFPNDGYLEYTVLPQLDGEAEVTPFSEFYDAVRDLCGDQEPDVPIYSTSQLDKALKLTLQLGKVPGYQALATCVTPALTATSDATAWAQLVYYTAKRFVTRIVASAFSTRAFSQRTGIPREAIEDLMQEIYELEHGDMAS